MNVKNLMKILLAAAICYSSYSQVDFMTAYTWISMVVDLFS